ncbi:hypothetical protein [Cellulomonas soli]|uniref:DUF5709 domain-containing protein n=1 Tax=Cellulomonas soli TaxID=931535 RepID=A0A512PFP8_9CELL|nr:hypothetical protein [Cellulomonas soli]NYI59828.1 hypothetical protein [Cellulomonas soli]GEP70028.1 hypothetical protein CSO01_27430 [Cellulomonas soli]
MSTVPGSDAWRDAGLEPVDPDQPRRLTDGPLPDGADPEEYEPGFARGDQEGDADEADVLEQDTEIPLGDDKDGDE